MEISGVWTGPVNAARALRSLAPACAAPVVPPYTALAGAYVHYWLTSRHLVLQWPNTIHTTYTNYRKYTTTTDLLPLLTNTKLKIYQNNRPTGHVSDAANVIFAGASEGKSSREAVPPGTGTAT